MATTLCSEATAKLHAGTHVSSSLTSGNWETFILEAEGKFCGDTKLNWVDIYSSLDADLKQMIELAVGNLAAFFAIKYDISSYPYGPTTVQFMANANIYIYDQIAKRVKEDHVKRFIRRGTNQ